MIFVFEGSNQSFRINNRFIEAVDIIQSLIFFQHL